MKQFELYRVIYWAFFIIAPTILLTYYLELGVGGVAVFVLFVLIGEHLWRRWRRLRKASEDE